MLRNLRALLAHLEENDFSTKTQDKALRKAIYLLESVSTVVGLGLQDIYTDAPEYAERVEKLRGAIASLTEF